MKATAVLDRIVTLAAARPWRIVILAVVLVSAALVHVASHFAMSTDSSALISPDVAWRVNERRMDAAFPQNGDAILVVVDGATPELAEGAAASLTRKLQADHAHVQAASRPDGGDYLAREGLLFTSDAEVSATTARMIEAQPFLGPLAADPSLRGIAGALRTMLDGVRRGEAPLDRLARPMAKLADSLEAQAAGHPGFFSWQALLGGRDSVAPPLRRLILVRPILDYGALQPGEPASAAIRGATRSLALDPAHGVTVRLTGSMPLADEEFASLADKAWLVGGVMLAAMLATLWLATRSGRIVVAILVTTLAGLIATTAVGLLAVGRFNLISVAFIPLFVGLGVDFGIQLSVRFQSERLGGATPPEAIRRAAAALGASLLLAAGAVCLGFLAFLPTAYLGIAELGVIAGLGMIIALALSISLLPALLVLLDPRPPAGEMRSRALAPADAFLLRRRKLILGLFGLSMAASIALLPLVRFDFNPLHLRAPTGEAMATLSDLMRDPDRNPNTIDLLAPNLAAARRLAARLAALPEVGRVLTAESFVPERQQGKLATIADAQMLLDLTLDPIAPAAPPNDAATIVALRDTAVALGEAAAGGGSPVHADARRLGRAMSGLASAPPAARTQASARLAEPLRIMLARMRASLAASPATLADVPAELKRDWIAPDGSMRIQLLPRDGSDNEALARFTAAVQSVAPDATGVAVSTQEAAHTVALAFVQAGLLALAVVSLLLFAVLRDAREVAFTLAPVVLSGFLTLGTCVLIGQPINFANIIAFPLLLGVGTAFHIYFVMAWRGGATDLLQSSLARGVFFSALATGSAFGSLWLSSHPGTASMGKILMISLAWTLVCALIFEPALLGPPRRGAGSAQR